MRGVGTQDSVTTGLGPQPHSQPPRHFSTYRHLWAGAGEDALHGRGHGGDGDARRAGPQVPEPTGLGCSCVRQLSNAERDPPQTRPKSYRVQSETRTRGLGLKLRPSPSPARPLRRQKSCSLRPRSGLGLKPRSPKPNPLPALTCSIPRGTPPAPAKTPPLAPPLPAAPRCAPALKPCLGPAPPSTSTRFSATAPILATVAFNRSWRRSDSVQRPLPT